jgi:hypothetical protein
MIIILKERHKLPMFENKLLKKLFGPQKDKQVTSVDRTINVSSYSGQAL